MSKVEASKPVSSRSVTKTRPTVTQFDDKAQKLFDEVSATWILNAPTQAILELVCLQMTLARRCIEIAEKEKLCCHDAKGTLKLHPLLAQGHACRNSASSNLQRLLTNLAAT